MAIHRKASPPLAVPILRTYRSTKRKAAAVASYDAEWDSREARVHLEPEENDEVMFDLEDDEGNNTGRRSDTGRSAGPSGHARLERRSELRELLAAPCGGKEAEVAAIVDAFVAREGSMEMQSEKTGPYEALVADLEARGYRTRVATSIVKGSDYLHTRSHAFAVVTMSSSGGVPKSLVVDLCFGSIFKVARPTEHYAALMEDVPSTFVGWAEQLRTAVCLLGREIETSFAEEGMPLPPWRHTKSMLSCWFSDPRAAQQGFRQPVGCGPAMPRPAASNMFVIGPAC